MNKNKKEISTVKTMNGEKGLGRRGFFGLMGSITAGAIAAKTGSQITKESMAKVQTHTNGEIKLDSSTPHKFVLPHNPNQVYVTDSTCVTFFGGSRYGK